MVLVFVGFFLKSLFNQYVLKVLDVIWKNICEAIGMILVYLLWSSLGATSTSASSVSPSPK